MQINCVIRYSYLVHVKDFAGGLLHLTHGMDEVPEARFSYSGRCSEKLHAVSRGVGVGGGGSLATDYLELTKTGLDIRDKPIAKRIRIRKVPSNIDCMFAMQMDSR